MRRESLVEYYKHIGDYYNTDHNHKELSAWAGLVLFFGFCAVISQIDTISSWPRIANIVIIFITIVVAYVVFRYMSNQFSLRDEAGDYSAAALKISLDLMDQSLSEKDLQDYAIPNTVSSESKSVAPYVLSKKIFEKVSILSNKGDKHRLTTKKLTYTLLVVSSLLILLQRLSVVLN